MPQNVYPVILMLSCYHQIRLHCFTERNLIWVKNPWLAQSTITSQGSISLMRKNKASPCHSCIDSTIIYHLLKVFIISNVSIANNWNICKTLSYNTTARNLAWKCLPHLQQSIPICLPSFISSLPRIPC